MINFQTGYDAANYNYSKVTVNAGKTFVESTRASDNNGGYTRVSGLLADFLNNGMSILARTATGVLYDTTVNGSGALGDVMIVNRSAVTGSFVHVFFDDKDGFVANLGSPLAPSGGLRLSNGESYKPDRPVSYVGILGSGYNIDFSARFNRNPNML